MKPTLLIILLLLTNPSWAQPCDTLTSMKWLLGEWATKSGDSTTRETWRQVSSTTYEGSGKTFTQGQLKSEESLRIVKMSGALYFITKVSHNPHPVIFSLVNCTENSARFENLAHDFPKRIEYSQPRLNQLSAEISDTGSKGFRINFTRQSSAKN